MTRPAPLDQATRDRVTRTGLDATLFVEAGAGSGKTSVLVDRVVGLVANDGVRLCDIAAITFTEAAASELRDRIRVELERREGDPTLGDLASERCRIALDDADLAAITTLHGFAKRVLAELPADAGLPPRVEILDAINSQLESEARWERFVDALHADPANEELLVRAQLADVALEPRYEGHSTMKDVAAELTQNWDRLETFLDPHRVGAPPPGSASVPLAVIDFDEFDAAVDSLSKLADRCSDLDDLFYETLTRRLLPELRAIVALDDPHRKLRALATQKRKKGWSAGRGGKDGAWGGFKGAAKAAKDLVTALNDASDRVIAAVAHEVLEQLLVAIGREVLSAAEARRSEGRLEFHDLLVLARRLLRSSARSRQILHQRYTRLLLDEFQDTDPIQLELAVLIATSWSGPGVPHWSEAPIDEGRLFFVGDPKQSIYRFRRASIALFLEARATFGPHGSWLRLDTNFRTVPDVVNWVNELFGTLMADEVAGCQPKYESLRADRSRSPTGDHRPLLLGGPGESVRAAELRRREAADVAATIETIRAEPSAWPVFDRRLEQWRDARLSDVTILVPTRTSLPELGDALDARDIAFRLDTGTLVYDTQEVRDALASLRAIDDPTDELALVTALRSPLYACADTDLLTFRQAHGSWDLRRATPDSLSDGHPVVAALAHLRSMWADRNWAGPSDLLDRLLRERRADLLAFGVDRPVEVWRRLRFLVDQARLYEENGGRGLRGFVEWAELQRSEGAGVHEPVLPEDDDASVRVLTIHGSKGLEFPITILSGLTTKSGSARRGVSLLWDDDDGTPSLSLRKGVATNNHDPRADVEIEMDGYEKLRLLYVACTRACDHLVVSCHHKEGDRSFAGIIWSEMAQRPGSRTVPLPIEAAASSSPQSTSGADQRDGEDSTDPGEWMSRRSGWHRRRLAAIGANLVPRVTSATAIATASATPPSERHDHGGPDDGERDDDLGPDDEDAERDLRDRPDIVPLPVRRRGRVNTAIGRAVHATLETLDLAAPRHIEAVSLRHARDEGIAELADQVAAMVRSALASDTLRDAADSTHHKEVYVAAPVGARVIEGYVDLLVETADGLVVIDYKTDHVTEATVDDKVAVYELQAAAYAVALEVSTGLPVIDCRFVFCRTGGAIERPVADLATAKQRVIAQVATRT